MLDYYFGTTCTETVQYSVLLLLPYCSHWEPSATLLVTITHYWGTQSHNITFLAWPLVNYLLAINGFNLYWTIWNNLNWSNSFQLSLSQMFSLNIHIWRGTIMETFLRKVLKTALWIFKCCLTQFGFFWVKGLPR